VTAAGPLLQRDDLLARYARQILLPQIDLAGQEALAAARVLLVGLGGLGCPAALYLAAAGVGELVLADDDTVDLTNLQRQVLFGEADLGLPKAVAATTRLTALNPHVRLTPLVLRLAGERLKEQVTASTVVLDGSDNFATRQAVNRACVAARRPLVSAAAIRFEAQFAVFDPRLPASPCYACLYPEVGMDATDAAPAERCTAAGVIGPLVGVMGSLQALAAIRLITGAGESPAGALLVFDALRLEWQRLELPRDPACPVCGADGR
jgi:adenylyltransferase/sulfurtransferase